MPPCALSQFLALRDEHSGHARQCSSKTIYLVLEKTCPEKERSSQGVTLTASRGVSSKWFCIFRCVRAKKVSHTEFFLFHVSWIRKVISKTGTYASARPGDRSSASVASKCEA
jgi:hypothetical protein